MKTILIYSLIATLLVVVSFEAKGINVGDHTFANSQGYTKNYFYYHGLK